MPSHAADSAAPFAVRPGVAAAGLLAAGALCLALYLPALNGPSLLDDTTVLAPLIEAGAAGHAHLDHLFSHSGPLGRPIAMASFIANAKLHGGVLWYWKATNVLIHAAVGAALFVLFRELFSACGSTAAASRYAALLGALIWLAHPLHVSTVMYTVQRMTQLAALFCVLGMVAYVRGRIAFAQGRPHVLSILAAFIVFTPLAALSKETGLLLPLFLAAIELTVFAGSNRSRPRWLVWLFLAGLILPYAAAAAYILSDIEAHVLNAYVMRDFTPFERILTEARVLLSYLQWIIAPRRSDLGFYHDDFRVTRSVVAEPDAMAAIAVLALLLGGAWMLRRRAPLTALGVLVFFAGHLLESTLFGLELMYEHRNYLPSAGIVLAAVAAALAIERQRVAVLGGSALVLVFAATTFVRAQLWGDEGALYGSFVAAHPASTRARVTLAEWQTVRGDFHAALATLNGAESVALSVHRLRVLCARDRRAGSGARAAFDAVTAAPVVGNVTVDALNLLARQSVDGYCVMDREALARALELVAARPLPATLRYRSYFYAALLRHRLGDVDGARALIEKAAASEPDDPVPWYVHAEWAADAGDMASARSLLREARARAASGRRDYAGIDAGVAELIEP